ncbi:MAG: hypothetical protein ACE5KA_02695 [Nitrososphaerales archaeon]
MKTTVFVILGLLLSATAANVVYAQDSVTRKTENITIPYTAADAVLLSPEHYDFPSEHVANWILTMDNNLEYNEDNPEAKIVLRLKETQADTDFVEIAMLSPPSQTLWVAVANEQVGYMRMVENSNAWFVGKPVTASLVQNDKLSINNGVRTVLDRLRIGEFTLGTIEVYGRDNADAGVSALSGEVLLEVVSGNPLDNPIMMIPPLVAVITGGVIVTLLLIKKRT